MRKKAFGLAIVIVFLLGSSNVFAAPNYSHRSWFNKLTDSIATIGKSPAEKKAIIRLRTENRRAVRKQRADFLKQKEKKELMHQQIDEVMRKVNAKNQAR